MNIQEALTHPDFRSGTAWARPARGWHGTALTVDYPLASHEEGTWMYLNVVPQEEPGKTICWAPYLSDLTANWELLPPEEVLEEKNVSE